jgi:hypothetical protein
MHSRLRQAVRVAAAVLLATLWGCAELSGPAPAPNSAEISGDSTLRVVAGHFETDVPFGLGDSGAALVGRTIAVGRERVGIAAATPDPRDPDHEIELYRFIRADAAHTPYCPGDGLGFPVAGPGAEGRTSIVCLGTAEARCVHLGYRPWRKAADGTSLRDYDEACVRALHADYCGSGNSHSNRGDALALYDQLGIQRLRTAEGMSFEAGWGARGAVCVNHIRPPGHLTLKDLSNECANLPRAKLGNSCDERDPALIFTKSPTAPAS